jgi:ATP-dependent exoDNAse (exonuclease V) alpha subunit
MNLNLTSQQSTALNMMDNFLEKPGSGVFILKGYAGTGKTTLLQHWAMQLSKAGKKFVLLAPTGRAAVVLKSKTGLNSQTLHSELYHFSDIDGEPPESDKELKPESYGQMRLLFSIRQPDEETNMIYIVDEASMVSDEPGDSTSYAHFGSGHLLSDLLQIIGTNKVVFSGDPCQLPPIEGEDSPALSEEWMKKQGKSVFSYELSKILRQNEDSGILLLAGKARNLALQNHKLPQWVKLPAKDINQVSILDYVQMKRLYIDSIISGEKNSIAICHSNFNCSDINKSVRLKLFGNTDAELQVGDLLMVTQNNRLVPFTNGDFAEVTNIGIETPYLGIKFIHVTVKSQLTGLEHEVLLCKEPLYNGQSNLRPEQQRMLMIDFSKRMRQKNIKPKSSEYFQALQKDPYLNSLRANFGYAITCHKSQGGEWDNVYLFLHKGMYIMGAETLTRWWYTGITRAKKELFITDGWWIG